ncbi:MAG: hypothetical protein KME17_24780 [Cyanosarcina radialis HA8281-LM2]|jgi:hypothetical protein|nr:hypothetical protein [Cyanosarcina radialis HA8281-LM2]
MPSSPILNNHKPPKLVEAGDRSDDFISQIDANGTNNGQIPKNDDWSDATEQLLDSLPPVWTRGLLYFLMVFFGIALPWLICSQVDESVTSRGQLELQKETVKASSIVRAEISMKDSAFLEVGMPVKIKFDAYPFQNYGVATGRLVEILLPAEIASNNLDRVPKYQLRIKLDRACLPTATKCLNLRPGETATVEIVIRQRRLIDYVTNL